MINKLTLIGRCGRDARVGMTTNGKHYAAVSVASGKDQNTTWFDVVGYEKNAEWLAKATKGTLVYVEGPVSLNQYQGKDGTQKASVQLTAFNVRLLSGSEAQQPVQESASFEQDDSVPF